MIKKLFLNDKFILLLILINSVVLVLGGYNELRIDQLVLAALDNLITVLFIAELLVKTKEFGVKTYLKSNWNLFDFILVLISVPALVTYIFSIELIDVSFLLVFRILRVFKAFRFFKFIPNVGELVDGIQRALKASVFVFIGFIIYVFVIGILSFYIFQGSGSSYFKDPMISLYSTFKIFTVEGWFEIPEQIIQNYSKTASFFTYIYFVFVVLTGGIIGLSLVNSIFVDTMVSDNNDELEKKIDSLDDKLNEILTKISDHETGKDT
ncbi:ion transporter [bacterium]|nr:ion transporter [bacterium]